MHNRELKFATTKKLESPRATQSPNLVNLAV